MFKTNGRPRRMGGARPQQKQREERVPVTKSATICIDGADLVVNGTLRDINKNGARISVTNSQTIPDYFLLITRGENLVARARVAWRKANEIGVQFMQSATLDMEERYRKAQAAAYAKMQHEMEMQRQQQAAMMAQQEAEQRAMEEHIAQQRKALLASIGMDPEAPFTEDDLKACYRKEAMRRHPDQGGSMEAFQELNNIYRYLMQFAERTAEAPAMETPDQPIAMAQ